jgi:DNA-binding NarL/FixJ family response regulator
LVDDHPLVLEGLRKLLEPSFKVVGVMRDGREAVAAAERLRPDLVIIDLSMPGLDGVEATRRLRATVPETRILVFSVHTEASWVRAAFDAGAQGYLAKTCAPEEIEIAVREVLKGRCWVCSAVAGSVILDQKAPARRNESVSGPAGEVLTRRERDIVRLVGRGMGNKEIAVLLGVAVTTVRSHLNKVYDKLGSGGRVNLALLAANDGEWPNCACSIAIACTRWDLR